MNLPPCLPLAPASTRLAWAFPPLPCLLALLLLPLAPALAKDKKASAAPEEAAPPASLLFVNAVGDKGLAFLVIGGADANPAGFAAGAVTGWVQFPAGELDLVVEHQPLGQVDLRRELAPGSHQAFIAHFRSESQADRGRPPRPTIGVLALPCARAGKKIAPDQRLLVLVNVTQEERLALDLGGEKAALPRLQPVEMTVDSGTGFVPVTPVAAEGVDPATVEALTTLNLEEPAVTYVVVHETAAGGLSAVTFTEPLAEPPQEDKAAP